MEVYWKIRFLEGGGGTKKLPKKKGVLDCFGDLSEGLLKKVGDVFGRGYYPNVPYDGKFYLYCLFQFRPFSDLQLVQIWSINYALYFGSVKIYKQKHCLYWSVFSTDINRKIIFNFLLLFKVFLLVSKLYESSHNFFWHAQKLRQGLYLRGFIIVINWRFNSNIPVIFKFFFTWFVNCLSHFFRHFLLVSKLHDLNPWFQRYPEA